MSGLKLTLKIFKFALFISFFGYTLWTVAANNNAILINSNNLSIDRQKNIAFFEGQVILWFEDTVLKTEKIKIIYKNDGKNKSIEKIIIPVSLSAYKHETDQVIIADSALYEQAQAKLTLQGNVILEYQNRILKTPKLIYYTKFKQSNKFN